MSVDVSLSVVRRVEVWSANLTNNLVPMAKACGLYEYIYEPGKWDCKVAEDLIEPLKEGLRLLKENPPKYKAYQPANGWGTYDHFVHWVDEYILQCQANPDAEIGIH